MIGHRPVRWWIKEAAALLALAGCVWLLTLWLPS